MFRKRLRTERNAGCPWSFKDTSVAFKKFIATASIFHPQFYINFESILFSILFTKQANFSLCAANEVTASHYPHMISHSVVLGFGTLCRLIYSTRLLPSGWC